MDSPGHIEELEQLDAALDAALADLPTLQDILHTRLHDLLPKLPEEVTPQDFLIDAQPLSEWVHRRLGNPHAPQVAADALTAYRQGGQVHAIVSYPHQLQQLIDLVAGDPAMLHREYLVRYWRVKQVQQAPLALWLKNLLRSQLQAQAALRSLDGTLDNTGKQLVDQLLATPDALGRATIPAFKRPGVYGIRFANRDHSVSITLPCAFVVTQRDARGHYDLSGAFSIPEDHEQTEIPSGADTGTALLSTLGGGLEVFASLQDLYAEVAERLDDDRQATDLLTGLNEAQRQAVLSAEQLIWGPVQGDIFERSASDLRNWQLKQPELEVAAWQGPLELGALGERLKQAAHLGQLFNHQAILRARYAALLEKNLPSWLKAASDEQKIDIMHSLHDLAAALAFAASPGLPTIEQFGERAYLLDYAREAVKKRVQADLGLVIDPASITLSITYAQQTGPIPPPTNPTSSIPGRTREQAGYPVTLVTQRYSLSELALTNIAAFDSDYRLTARVHCPTGQPCKGLTPDYVRDMIRHLNVASSYEQFVRTRLLDSPDAQWRREHYRSVTYARMHAEALKARYAGHLRVDRSERGYQWIRSVLDNPAGPCQVEGHALQVQQLLISGATIRGVLVITAAQPGSVPMQVYYTPDSPDRRPWREYKDSAQWLKTFKATPSLREYLAARAGLSDQAAVRQTLQARGAASRVRLQPIEGDFLDMSYEAQVRQVLSNVDSLSTSTEQMDLNSLLAYGVMLAEAATVTLPTRLLLPIAVARAFLTLWQGLDSLRNEQNDEALKYFMDSISHVAEAGTSLLGATFMARAMRKLPVRGPVAVNPSLALRQEPENLRFRIDSPYKEGVYEQVANDGGPSQYYMKDKAGRTYQVLFDGAKWHVVDARNPDAIFKPQIQRNADGELEIVRAVHWLGKVPDVPRLLAEHQRDDVPLPRLDLDARGLAWWQGARYLVIGTFVLAVRKSLRDDRFTLLPPQEQVGHGAAVLLRYSAGWEIKVKQAGVISAWLPVLHFSPGH